MQINYPRFARKSQFIEPALSQFPPPSTTSFVVFNFNAIKPCVVLNLLLDILMMAYPSFVCVVHLNFKIFDSW